MARKNPEDTKIYQTEYYKKKRAEKAKDIAQNRRDKAEKSTATKKKYAFVQQKSQDDAVYVALELMASKHYNTVSSYIREAVVEKLIKDRYLRG